MRNMLWAIIIAGSSLRVSCEERIDLNSIRGLIQAHDMASLLPVGDNLERAWAKDHDPKYFNDMSALCYELYSNSVSNVKEYELFQQFASQMFAKQNAGGSEGPSFAFGHQAKIADWLMGDNAFTINLRGAELEKIRSKNTRLLMILFRRLQDSLPHNFAPRPVSVNVDVPDVGTKEPTVAGMDPKQIKDPIKRAAYEKAIAANNQEIEFQNISREQKRYSPKVKAFLINAYSKDPVNFDELNEYMLLGGLDDSLRTEIITTIATATKKEPPAGLVIAATKK